MAEPIRQWTVQEPLRGRADLAVFEDVTAAWDHAAAVCGMTEPCVVRCPDGQRFFLFRESAVVEVSTRHLVVGTTRRVVEP